MIIAVVVVRIVGSRCSGSPIEITKQIIQFYTRESSLVNFCFFINEAFYEKLRKDKKLQLHASTNYNDLICKFA